MKVGCNPLLKDQCKERTNDATGTRTYERTMEATHERTNKRTNKTKTESWIDLKKLTQQPVQCNILKIVRF